MFSYYNNLRCKVVDRAGIGQRLYFSHLRWQTTPLWATVSCGFPRKLANLLRVQRATR